MLRKRPWTRGGRGVPDESHLLLGAETLVFTQFFARDSTKPLQITPFFALCEPIFCLDECKKRWHLRVFQKIEDCDVSKTL